MAAAPQYKVYDSAGQYRAACKDPTDAAILAAALGDGTTIRNGHSARSIVWTEGAEDQPAGESYDHVAMTIFERIA